MEKTLWGMYVQGSDDWYAAHSLKHAREMSHSLNQQIGARGHDDEFEPNVWAMPDLWPFTADAHQAALLQQEAGRHKKSVSA